MTDSNSADTGQEGGTSVPVRTPLNSASTFDQNRLAILDHAGSFTFFLREVPLPWNEVKHLCPRERYETVQSAAEHRRMGRRRS